jgi:periplasmic protein CpxP/Spy
MFVTTVSFRHVLAAATVLSTLALAAPAHVAAATSQQAATAPAPDASAAKTPRAKRATTDRSEARIALLHDRLKITAAQEPQWNAVAQVMRDNAKTVQALGEGRPAKGTPVNAVDRLRTSEKYAAARDAELTKLIPALQKLYDSLSDEQKKAADAAFSSGPRRVNRNRM